MIWVIRAPSGAAVSAACASVVALLLYGSALPGLLPSVVESSPRVGAPGGGPRSPPPALVAHSVWLNSFTLLKFNFICMLGYAMI